MKKLVNTDTVLGLTVGAASLWLLLSSHRLSALAFVLPGDAPPFLVPQMFLYMGLALAAAILAGGLIKGGVAFGAQDWWAMLAIAIVLTAAVCLLPRIGYLIVAPVAVFVICRLLGYRNHLVNGLVALGVPVALHAALSGFANMPLPKIPGLDF